VALQVPAIRARCRSSATDSGTSQTLSQDIVVRQHGVTIDMMRFPGEFTITLPNRYSKASIAPFRRGTMFIAPPLVE
jgi:hypothetical protein